MFKTLLHAFIEHTTFNINAVVKYVKHQSVSLVTRASVRPVRPVSLCVNLCVSCHCVR